jgi:class 3 adenylate cyclase
MSTSQTDLGLAASPSLEPVIEDDDDDDQSSHFSEKDIENAKQRAAKMERKQLAARETKIVFWLRILCFAILLSTAVVVSLGVYFYTKNDEEEDFKHVYDASAERVIQSFHNSVAHLLAGVDAFSVAVTSYALDTGATFPNVTVPDLELRGGNTRVITKSVASTWFPLVHEEDRLGWEAYATQTHMHQMRSFQAENGYILRQDEVFGLESNIMMPPTGGTAGQQPPGESGSMENPNGQGMQTTQQQGSQPPGETGIENSGEQGMQMNQQQQDSQQEATQLGQGDSAGASNGQPADGQCGDAGNPLAGKPFSPVLTTFQGQIQPNNTGPYLPFWQTSPALPLPALSNSNILTFPPLAASVSKVIETNQAYLSIAVEPAAMFAMFLARGQYRHSQEIFLGDAVTPLAYPVFDNFSPNRKLVGITLSNIYWRLHFEQVLPPNARGVIAVLENNVNQSFTYQLDGPDVTFLGHGDLHDAQFDDMRWSADVSEFMKGYSSPETQGFVAVPLTEEGVQYSLRIYPSQDMKDDFVTTQPIIFAFIVALIFLFTATFLSIYNILVEQRQKVVMDRAVRSTAVVSSLFPETVKERLINDAATDATSKSSSWKVESKNGKHTKRNLAALSESPSSHLRPKGKPIADKFEDTTVMFADIAGFTSWSSDRDPQQVFELLETLYGAFDSLALARNVFKVETIGDCYLAITGCPSPQPDHDSRMAKFARDCMHKVRELTDILAESLGDDTRTLSFRVGLHSGSVTAGVLRGDKSRFQLFGDTVNAAARIESHGVKGRIHLSQATADAIRKAGKSTWIIPRVVKIKAKAKGGLQTYSLTGKLMKVRLLAASSMASSRGLTSAEFDSTDRDMTEKNTSSDHVMSPGEDTTTSEFTEPGVLNKLLKKPNLVISHLRSNCTYWVCA